MQKNLLGIMIFHKFVNSSTYFIFTLFTFSTLKQIKNPHYNSGNILIKFFHIISRNVLYDYSEIDDKAKTEQIEME